jgi:Ni/Fe-hydrogenase subunit HybB-like protein
MSARNLRSRFWRGVFFLLLAVGSVLTVVRFRYGIGAVSNLNDTYPWGLWVGFDCLSGVGLAAGGFTLTAIVYIFNVKRFEPIVRPVILTAFLGYLLEVGALMYDLGRPWNLWHPLVMWNPRSVMFVVSWCVTIYLAILAVEVSGMFFERLGWERPRRIQRRFMVPLVIAGVLVSVIHQSSLGAFYLLVPGKLHQLWYTSWLPLLFWASSITVGLAMIVFESNLSQKAFGKHLDDSLLLEIGRIMTPLVAFYGVLRVYDLARRGVLASSLGTGYEAHMFQLEFLLGVAAPLAILAAPSLRATIRGVHAASVLVILGFITNRLNVAITGLEGVKGASYVPSLAEVTITLMLVAIGFALFGLAVRFLPVFPQGSRPSESPRDLPTTAPALIPLTAASAK